MKINRRTLQFYWAVLKQTVQKWSADKVPQLGAALAFYSMLSLGPLLLLLLSGAALIYGHKAAQGQLLEQINSMIGEDGARAIQDMLSAASQKKNTGIWASILGVMTLLVGASGVFGQLQDSLNSIWQVKPVPGRNIMLMLRHRFLSFTMVLGSGFLLLTSLVLSAVLAAVGDSEMIPGDQMAMIVLNAIASFAVVTLLFASIFKYLPDTTIHWRDVWVGALLTATLFTLGKFAIGLYLGQSAMSSAYGAGGSLVVLLVWVYYSAQILFFGAEFTFVYTQMRHPASAKKISAKKQPQLSDKLRNHLP